MLSYRETFLTCFYKWLLKWYLALVLSLGWGVKINHYEWCTVQLCVCNHMLYVLYVWMCVLYMCLCLKCGQECVSIFSLEHGVKRGLISSNVIHTVTSHYFRSAGSPLLSVSLLPSLFCHFTHFLHHIKREHPASCCLHPLPPLSFLYLNFLLNSLSSS